MHIHERRSGKKFPVGCSSTPSSGFHETLKQDDGKTEKSAPAAAAADGKSQSASLTCSRPPEHYGVGGLQNLLRHAAPTRNGRHFEKPLRLHSSAARLTTVIRSIFKRKTLSDKRKLLLIACITTS